MRLKFTRLFFITFLTVLFCFDASCSKAPDGLERVRRRNALEKEARYLAERGDLDTAINLYWKAIEPNNINQEHEKSTATGAIIEILKWQGKYEEALEVNKWFLRHEKPTKAALEETAEIEALVSYQKTGSKEKVYEYIVTLKEENKKDLPPNGYGLGATIYISDILRLYDTIGDLDAGIAYIDEVLEYGYSRNDEYVRVKTSEEALEKGYQTAAEYLKVREAFEKDKAEGKKGRATQAIIQSDYFPW